MTEKNSASKRLYLLIILVVLIVAGGGMLFRTKFDFDIRKKGAADETTIDQSTYQAVFLSNGQVYFGHLDDIRRPIFVLKDVYYLQIKEELQGAPSDEQSREQKEDKTPEDESPFTLVKLGEELHQPQSEMSMNGDHILFWENLQSDSRIIQAINEYKKDKSE